MKNTLCTLAAAALLLTAGCGCGLWWIDGDAPDRNELVRNVIPGSFSRKEAVNRMIAQLLAYGSAERWSAQRVGYDASDLTLEVWNGVRIPLNLTRGTPETEWQLLSRVDGTRWTLELSFDGEAVRSWEIEVYDLP